MRIGIIGWYGHANAGDERMLSCLQRLFTNHTLYMVNDLQLPSATLTELNRCDFVLFGGGGLILRGCAAYAPRFDLITAPFACIGISVESVHAADQVLLDMLMRKSIFIHVRDTDSARIFASSGKVISGVDLTFLYPFEVVEEVSQDRCGVNLRDWRYWTGQHGGTFDLFMRRVTARAPGLRQWYPLPKWSPDRAVSIIQEHFQQLFPLALYVEEGARTDIQEMSPYFPTEIPPFIPEHLRECRYLVGMRLHALIFACQMGIPFVSLSYQPKNTIFCKSVGVESLSVDPTRLNSLPGACHEMKTQYRVVREHLLTYRESAHQTALRDARTILQMMGCK